MQHRLAFLSLLCLDYLVLMILKVDELALMVSCQVISAQLSELVLKAILWLPLGIYSPQLISLGLEILSQLACSISLEIVAGLIH